MAGSAVTSVLNNVGTFAAQETTLLCGVTNEVVLLKAELQLLQGFLRDVDSKGRPGDRGIAILVRQIKDAAYEADNLIEAADYMHRRNMLKKGFMGAISRYARLPCDLTTLHKIGVGIQLVRRKIYEIFESETRFKIVDLGNTSVENFGVDDEVPPQNFEDVVIVGFEDEYKEIVEKLVEGENSLSAISIVAMGGAGKTTLAKKIYSSSRVKQHFTKIAWVTVSQKYKSVNLLKDILKQITEKKDELIDTMKECEVGKEIRDSLLKTRYFVVLDDVWETDTWEQLNKTVKAFPDETNGSRILLTTRKEDVASHVEMPTHVHQLKKLDDEKSWELFSSKALPSYKMSKISDVNRFRELGRTLAKKCDGLPLALAVLGGYLSKNLDAQIWSDILYDWPSTKNGQMMRDILARSYKDLKNHYLRSCLLYLAGFPEDYEISVSDLIELWIADSFIPHTHNHTLEETARKYVSELAQRCLVQVVGRSSAHGWILTVRIHDILRDWCIEEARQDGFLDVMNKSAGQACASSSSDNMISYRYYCQKLSDEILPTTNNVRALLGFGLSSVSFLKLRSLRVLHIEDSRLNDLARVIGGCIHLRCLRLRRCGLLMLPSSIGQLLYLQTVDLSGTERDSRIPKSLWNIPTLRHVYLGNGFSLPPPARSVSQDRKELQTFHLHVPVVGTKYHYHDMVVFLGQMNQLTTLYLFMRPIPLKVINILANMSHLVDISLNKFGVLDKLPAKFPQSLRSLVLHADVIKQDPMPILEKLQCLVVLKVWGYEGQTMSFSMQGFPRMQELQLGKFSTMEWKMEEGTMPKLSLLSLLWCEKMRMLPDGLRHLQSLNHLELFHMPIISEDDSTRQELLRKGCKVDQYN